MLIRNALTPVSSRARNVFGFSVAGPSVAMILVFRGNLLSGAFCNAALRRSNSWFEECKARRCPSLLGSTEMCPLPATPLDSLVLSTIMDGSFVIFHSASNGDAEEVVACDKYPAIKCLELGSSFESLVMWSLAGGACAGFALGRNKLCNESASS
jgi:hypothetical protein